MGKKQMDQLDIDASNAIKAGMTYGKYMAMKNPTTIVREPEGQKHTCLFCGKVFYVTQKKVRKYCSDQCRELSYAHKRKEPALKACPICGKEFVAETYRNKYCGEFCARVAQGQRCKEYQERKKKEARSNG